MPISPWTPPFTRFFLAQSLSWLGSSMTPVALSFGILRRTGEIEMLSLVLVANTAPMLLFLLLGGVVADRLPRGRLLVLTHLAAAVTQAASAAWFFWSDAPFGVLLVLSALNGLSTAFTAPALRGIVAELVPAQALEKANSARVASRNGFRLLGPAVAGTIVALGGAGWALALDAACLGGATVLLTTLHAGERVQSGNSVLGDLREGWREFAARSWLWTVTASFFGVNFLIGAIWSVLGPVIAEGTIGPVGWGMVLGARAGGQILSSVVSYRWAPSRPLVAGQVLLLPYAALFALLVMDPGIIVLAIVAGAAGLGAGIAGVLWESTLQREIRKEALGRVTSMDMLGSFASVPLGQLAAPLLLAGLGVRPTAVAGSIALTVLLVLPLLVPSVRRLRR